MPSIIQKEYTSRSGGGKRIAVCCPIFDIADQTNAVIGGFVHHCDIPRVEVSGAKYITTYQLCGDFEPGNLDTDAEGYRNRYLEKIIYTGTTPVTKTTTTYSRDATTGACQSTTISENIGNVSPRPPNEYNDLDTWTNALAAGVDRFSDGLGQFLEAFYQPKSAPGFNGNGDGFHTKQRFQYYVLCTRLFPGVTYRVSLALDSANNYNGSSWNYSKDGAVNHDLTASDFFHIIGGALNDAITAEEFKTNGYSLSPSSYDLPSGESVIVIDGSLEFDYPEDQNTAKRIQASDNVNSPTSMQCYINTIPE
jgi:hypothetical protein